NFCKRPLAGAFHNDLVMDVSDHGIPGPLQPYDGRCKDVTRYSLSRVLGKTPAVGVHPARCLLGVHVAQLTDAGGVAVRPSLVYPFLADTVIRYRPATWQHDPPRRVVAAFNVQLVAGPAVALAKRFLKVSPKRHYVTIRFAPLVHHELQLAIGAVCSHRPQRTDPAVIA